MSNKRRVQLHRAALQWCSDRALLCVKAGIGAARI